MLLFTLLICPLVLFCYWIKDKNSQSRMYSIVTLADRMKYYEELSQQVTNVTPYQSYIIRLDGKNFSSQTANLVKPFDDVFSEAMLLTTRDLLKEFHGTTAYVQSDEISIVFKSVCTQDEYNNKTNKSTHLFGGRTSKLLSILAGFASTRFTVNFADLLEKSLDDPNEYNRNCHTNYLNKLNEKGKLSNATFCFDARLIVVPENKTYEVVNNLIWRSVHDGYRNYVSSIARNYYSKNKLNNLKTNERVELLKREENVSIEDQPTHYKYGWYLKHETTEVETEKGTGFRSNITAKSLKLYYSEETEKMMYSKYWNDVSESLEFGETRRLL